MSKHILLVDDHAANRTVLARRLARRGHQVTEAADGLEAVRLAFELKPDCILMDLSMPTVSGFTAMERIHANADTEATPVIAITAHAMDDVRRRCEEAGFADFVTKPIDFQSLLESVDRAMGGACTPEAALGS